MDHVMDKDVWATIGDKRGAKRLEQVCNSHRALGESVVCIDLDDLEEIMTEVLDELYVSERSRKNYVRRCEELEAECELPAEVTVVETVKNDSGHRFVAVFTDHDRAMELKAALKKDGEYVWLTRHAAVNPAVPDSWAAVERDARTIDGACTDLMSAADLVARCKKLAGVE